MVIKTPSITTVDVNQLAEDVKNAETSITNLQNNTMQFVASYDISSGVTSFKIELTDGDDFRDYIWKVYCVMPSSSSAKAVYLTPYNSSGGTYTGDSFLMYVQSTSSSSAEVSPSGYILKSSNEWYWQSEVKLDFVSELTLQMNHDDAYIVATSLTGRISGRTAYSRIEWGVNSDTIRGLKFTYDYSTSSVGRITVYKMRRE